MSILHTLTIASLIAALGTSCTTSKPEVDEDFSDLAGMDQKADYFSYRLKLLGSLVDGDTKSVRYSQTPRFRGYELTAAAGDRIDVWVRSNTGDALAWVLDGAFHVIAKNDDASDSTTDAHLAMTLPPSGAAAGRYYLVFRDYNLETRYFKISYARTPGAPVGAAWDQTAKDQIEALAVEDAPLTAFQVPLATLPAAAKARYAVSASVLEVPRTYRVPVEGRPVYVVLASDGSGEGGSVAIDLVDGNDRWFAHGMAHQLWDGGGGFSWSLDDSDPTMCPCGTAGEPALCTWMDGATMTSTSLTCE